MTDPASAALGLSLPYSQSVKQTLISYPFLSVVSDAICKKGWPLGLRKVWTACQLMGTYIHHLIVGTGTLTTKMLIFQELQTHIT
jgi:hypothetical protein